MKNEEIISVKVTVIKIVDGKTKTCTLRLQPDNYGIIKAARALNILEDLEQCKRWDSEPYAITRREKPSGGQTNLIQIQEAQEARKALNKSIYWAAERAYKKIDQVYKWVCPECNYANNQECEVCSNCGHIRGEKKEVDKVSRK